MTDTGASPFDATSPNLSSEERARRSSSFGDAAELYERYRPGPPAPTVDWLLPERSVCVVDLGAGTGAMTRLLVERVPRVIAIEPDDRMREVLTRNVPQATAIAGRGEAMPVGDASADAVLASSSWHWMDPIPTFRELERVLVPGGALGVVWSGPDLEGPFMVQARAMLAQRREPESDAASGGEGEGGGAGISSAIFDPSLGELRLTIPDGCSFTEPEHHVHTWNLQLNADELIGLLGTLSWVILMSDERRAAVFAEARRVLRDGLGIEGDVTVEVAYRADAWRTRRLDP